MVLDNTEAVALSVNSFKDELHNILHYWMQFAPDEDKGGFYGSISNDNLVDVNAVKGSVLNARILWSFSAAYNLTANQDYLLMAHRSADYIFQYLIDPKYGGVYWSVDSSGQPSDTKKQIYALAFAIYGLAEYYRATNEEKALSTAINLYQAIEKHSYDNDKGGYFEALTQDWQPIADVRLSEKDANEKKTMNTHLHILEAYTNLYRVWPDAALEEKIRKLVAIFQNHIVNTTTGHLMLFFNENWMPKSGMVSYGHDIEASWLLQEAAAVLKDEPLIQEVKAVVVQMAHAAARGLDKDGSMFYEEEHNVLIADKHWWVQAEAVVGFYNAYQITGDFSFYEKAAATWIFILQHIIDHQKGEWFWGVTADNQPMSGYDKAGFWKCPYHNSRACMELMKRLAGGH